MKVYIAKFENEPNVIKYGKSVNPLERAVRLEKDYGRCIKLQIFEMNDTSSEKKVSCEFKPYKQIPDNWGCGYTEFYSNEIYQQLFEFQSTLNNTFVKAYSKKEMPITTEPSEIETTLISSSDQLVNYIILNSCGTGLSVYEKTVLVHIAALVTPESNWTCAVSNETLCKYTMVSRSSMFRTIKELTDKGIVKYQRGTINRPNLYFIDLSVLSNYSKAVAVYESAPDLPCTFKTSRQRVEEFKETY